MRGRLACGRYKQRGAPAAEANNVFHHLTYGDVDVAAIADARERAALEAQARRRCRDVLSHAAVTARSNARCQQGGASACVPSAAQGLLPPCTDVGRTTASASGRESGRGQERR